MATSIRWQPLHYISCSKSHCHALSIFHPPMAAAPPMIAKLSLAARFAATKKLYILPWLLHFKHCDIHDFKHSTEFQIKINVVHFIQPDLVQKDNRHNWVKIQQWLWTGLNLMSAHVRSAARACLSPNLIEHQVPNATNTLEKNLQNTVKWKRMPSRNLLNPGQLSEAEKMLNTVHRQNMQKRHGKHLTWHLQMTSNSKVFKPDLFDGGWSPAALTAHLDQPDALCHGQRWLQSTVCIWQRTPSKPSSVIYVWCKPVAPSANKGARRL